MQRNGASEKCVASVQENRVWNVRPSLLQYLYEIPLELMMSETEMYGILFLGI